MKNDHLHPNVREVFRGAGVGAYKLATEQNRAYALDDFQSDALGALAKAAHEALIEGRGRSSWTREELSKEAFTPLLPFVDSMTQQRPQPEPEEPQIPRDPLTNQPVRNPFPDPVDLASQVVVRKTNPALASHLQRIAKDGGVTFAYLAELEAGKAQREKLRRLAYGEPEHEANPYRGRDIVARSNFEKSHDPEVTAFYRREGETPVTLPWAGQGNLTQLGQIAKHDPALRVLVDRAAQILRDWNAQDLAKLDATRRAAEAAHKRAQKLVGAAA